MAETSGSSSGSSGGRGAGTRRSTTRRSASARAQTGAKAGAGRAKPAAKSTAAKKPTAARSTAAKSTAAKSTAAKKPTAERSTGAKSTAAKSTSAAPKAGSAAKRGPADVRIDAVAARLRKLNERIIEAGRDAGEATLTTYEKALKSIASGIEKGPGRSDIDWVAHIAAAQAKFIREISESWSKAARDMLK